MKQKRRDNRNRVLHDGEYQKKDGRYEYRYIDAYGKRKSLYSTKLIATDLGNDLSLREKIRNMLCGIEVKKYPERAKKEEKENEKENDVLTIGKAFELMLDSRIDLSDSSITTYRRRFNNLKSISDSDILSFNKAKLKAFLAQMKKNGKSDNTLVNICGILTSIYDYAIDAELITNNPAKNLVKSVRKPDRSKRHALTDNQLERVISIMKEKGENNNYNFTMFLLLSGCRISEASALQWSDIDFNERTISINKSLNENLKIGTTKTSSGVRTIPMCDSMYSLLTKLRENKKKVSYDGYDDYVFHGIHTIALPSTIRMYHATIQKKYNMIEEELAKKENRNPNPIVLSPHIFRHTFCTKLIASGANIKSVQFIMGHSNSETTLSIYADSTEKNNKSAVNALDTIKL